jgi:hypothetical protein
MYKRDILRHKKGVDNMAMTNLVYGASETRSKISEIQNTVKSGLIPKMVNKNTHEISYMVNQKILESLLNRIEVNNVVEFDEDLKIYTVFNEIVPQIYGEGTTKVEAIDQMVVEAKSFAEDYAENIDLFSGILDGIQQFFIGNILLNIEDEIKIREILKVV